MPKIKNLINIDFVCPDNNEEEFVNIARLLNIKKLCFTYDLDDVVKDFNKNVKNFRCKIDQLQNTYNIALYLAVRFNGLKQRFKVKDIDFRVLKSNNPEIIRKCIEQKKADVIYGLEFHSRKDYMKQLDSGFNQILARFAHENEVMMAFSYSDLLQLDLNNRLKVLPRLMQNIKLYEKYKVSYDFFSFSNNPMLLRSRNNVEAFKRVLKIK